MGGGRYVGVALLVAASLMLAALMVGLTHEADQAITPNDEFFQVSLTSPPVIDPDTWTLRVEGLVERPLDLTYEQLVSLENVTEAAQLRCVTGPSATAYYTGIPLPRFMELIGVKEGARELAFFCADSLLGENYSTSLTIEELNRDDALLAWRMNNETLPVEQGFPLKLVVPGDWGYKWAKWIVRIAVIDYDYRGYWERRGWADDASISPISDWRAHAILLSLAAVLGGFSAVSGMASSRSPGIASRMPEFFPRRYHRYVSAAYYALLFLTFIYWSAATLDYRSALFYSFHGRIALMTVIFSAAGLLSGIPLLAGRQGWRTAHFMSNLGGYLLLLVTIFLGIMLAIG